LKLAYAVALGGGAGNEFTNATPLAERTLLPLISITKTIMGVPDLEAVWLLDHAPGRREAASRHVFDTGRYGFHFTGVTASGVPLFELTHPADVRLHGEGSR
jgi:hypothetical protein